MDTSTRAVTPRDLPRQRTEDTAADHRAELADLALSLSAQAHVRQRESVRTETDITPAIRARRWSAVRLVATIVFLAAVSAVSAFGVMSVRRTPQQSTSPTVAPASLATIRALGAAAATRLRDTGRAVDALACAAAYAADRAASPLLLPAATSSGPAGAYVAACLAAPTGR